LTVYNTVDNILIFCVGISIFAGWHGSHEVVGYNRRG